MSIKCPKCQHENPEASIYCAKSIAQKNPKLASGLMKKHIQDVQKDLQQYYRVVNKKG